MAKKAKAQTRQNGFLQVGSGPGRIKKVKSMHFSPGFSNFSLRRKKKANTNKKRKSKTRTHGRGNSKKKSTQIDMHSGFISKKLRNRPLYRDRPIDGVVNSLQNPFNKKTQMKPQQIAWGN